ncbi:MAG TPA: asparagine synthase (glutamine-hydrolyzing) [Clostridiales bacterium]|nr:asparagine synthase (glutamine-hydrolyzing) [Clostridiales bacterium]HQK73758.1 asparagine synthase (glutamine-hydrolyzing) [Clostridiales bacterium]
MCGFVGFVAERDEHTEKTIKAMADLIAHRGPDDEDYFIGDKAALGFRRLSIIDLATGGQPIYNEDRSKVLVYNGELYNYRELREQLVAAGHVFSTKTDSEVILHGYEQYGKELLSKMRGMFSFVIWDTKADKIFGARDIFGIKPFYYYIKDGVFLFASEIKAFLAHPKFVKKLNTARLPEYLSFEYIPDEETMFLGVRKLLGGHCFTYENGRMEIERYHEIAYRIEDDKTMDYWADTISRAFGDSTLAHKISDVEVGCFLSSGVDSSYVAREMSKNNKVKAFGVGYAEEKYSELPYAQELAATINVDFYPTKVSARDFFDIAPLVQYQMDEPLPNPSALPLYFLAKCAAEQVKVVLSGEGADELFGGYNYYKEPLEYEKYMKIPLVIRRGIGSLAQRLPPVRGKRFLVKGALPIERRFIRNNYVFTCREREELLARPCCAPDPSVFNKPYFDRAKELDDISKMQFVDIHSWLQFDILQKADKMSMANSLELRVPFLDKEMLKVAMRIPSRYRVTRTLTKVALRRAAAAQLPPKTANMKKLGFPVPLNDWLKQDEFYSRVKEMFDQPFAAEFFKPAAMMRLLEEHRQGRPNMKKIWSVYCFLLWYEEYFIKR